MGTVFKKTFTKPLPSGAEIFIREGQQFARWKNAKGKTRKGLVTASTDGQARILIESRTYTAKYRDGAGIVRIVATGCKDETAARSVLGDLERRAELVKAGVMTAGEDAIADHKSTTLALHLEGYRQNLLANGATSQHVKTTCRYIEIVAKDCSYLYLSDLALERFQRWLLKMERAGKSARTRNAYREALVVFCNWSVESKRLLSNPFARMKKADEKSDPRHRRRSMIEGELTKLLEVARIRPPSRCIDRSGWKTQRRKIRKPTRRNQGSPRLARPGAGPDLQDAGFDRASQRGIGFAHRGAIVP